MAEDAETSAPPEKKKTVTIEVLMEGPNGELYFQAIEADPEHLEELIAATKNSMIKRNLEKQLDKMKKEAQA